MRHHGPRCPQPVVAELRTALAEALHRQTLWLGGALAGATALLAAIGALT